MEGSYKRIREAMEKRAFPKRGIHDLKKHLFTLFSQCQIYWTMRCRYLLLKKVPSHLPDILPNDFRMPETEKYGLTALNCLCIIRLWEYFISTRNITQSQTNQKNKWVGTNAFFNKFLGTEWEQTKKELSDIGLSEDELDTIEYTKDQFELSDLDYYYSRIDLDDRYGYLNTLEAAIYMKPKSIVESVDAILTEKAEKYIVAKLNQQSVHADILLTFYLADLISYLTRGSIKNVSGNNKNADFTSECAAEADGMLKRINDILQQYISSDDQKQIEKIKDPFDKNQLLISQCRKWVIECQKEWETLKQDEEYVSIVKKLRTASEKNKII